MPFDNRHAPLNSPHLTGEPEAPTPGVNDNSERLATTRFVQAQKPQPTNNPTIDLLGDLRGRGTLSIDTTVIGLQGRALTSDVPADTEVYVWSQAGYAWELIPACLLGQQSDGDGLVQVSDGAGGFTGIAMSGDATWNTETGLLTLANTGVVPGLYPSANVRVDSKGRITVISSGILDPVIPDAPSDGLFYGRHNASWGSVAQLDSPAFTGNPTAPTPAIGDNSTSIATTAFVKAQGALGTAGLNLTALGTDAASALLLVDDFNEVLTIAPGTGVRLPVFMYTPLRRCRIAAYDIGSQEDLLVWPQAGQTFFSGGVSNGMDQPLTILSGNVMEVQAASATKVYMVSST